MEIAIKITIENEILQQLKLKGLNLDFSTFKKNGQIQIILLEKGSIAFKKLETTRLQSLPHINLDVLPFFSNLEANQQENPTQVAYSYCPLYLPTDPLLIL